jgi:hypothetical protein
MTLDHYRDCPREANLNAFKLWLTQRGARANHPLPHNSTHEAKWDYTYFHWLVLRGSCLPIIMIQLVPAGTGVPGPSSEKRQTTRCTLVSPDWFIWFWGTSLACYSVTVPGLSVVADLTYDPLDHSLRPNNDSTFKVSTQGEMIPHLQLVTRGPKRKGTSPVMY